MNPTELPSELQIQTLLQLSPEEILNYCQVNQRAREICQNNYFWNQKAERDFGISPQMIFNMSPYQQYRFIQTMNESWSHIYLLLHSGQFDKLHELIPIYGVGTMVSMAFDTRDFTLLNFLAPYIRETINMTNTIGMDSYKNIVMMAFADGTPAIVNYILSFNPQIMQDQTFLNELRDDLQASQSTAGLALLNTF